MMFILGMPGETHSTIEETLKSIRKLPVKNRKLHLKIALPVAFLGTELDKQIHDPSYVEEHGMRLIDEYDWEKAYLPRYTLLFDPSRELSASEMTDIPLDFAYGIYGVTASFGKQVEAFKDVRTLLDNNQISPEILAKLSNVFRKILIDGF
jgi:hypothetical protein